jgi:carboxypeptidase C (cathepsin A)
MYLFHVLLLVFLELVTGLAIDDVAPRNSTMRVFKRNGMSVTVFEHAETGSTMEYISNSGICENTPNVKQYSGYLSVGQNMNMWFWFFEARNNPETAPLAAWFNGGPGCSSMIGLFQENGPCTYNNGEAAGSPSHNKHSWNEYANMLYIDQPIGVGFSYGSSNVSSSKDAAPLVWNLIQAFYSQFPQYKSREFGIWSESYGGHYGPAFGKYIIDQNAAIAKGNVKGQRINLTAIGLNNAWINPLDNYRGQIDYSLSNGYKQIITPAQAKSRHQKLDQICRPALERCWKSDSNSDCSRALMSCKVQVEIPLVDAGDFSVYDVKERRNAKWPPQTYEKWLQTSAIQRMIGAKTKFVECPKSIHTKFIRTGDGMLSKQIWSNCVNL